MLPVRPSKVKNLLQKNQKYVWYKNGISLAKNRLVGSFQYGATGIKKLIYLNMVEDKKRKELEK